MVPGDPMARHYFSLFSFTILGCTGPYRTAFLDQVELHLVGPGGFLVTQLLALERCLQQPPEAVL